MAKHRKKDEGFPLSGEWGGKPQHNKVAKNISTSWLRLKEEKGKNVL